MIERTSGEVTSEPLVRSIRQVENELFALPAPVSDFKGREEELAKLEAALTREGRAVISSIEGLGGVGKTALAIQAAHRLTPRFPDGVVFLDMRGGSQQPATAENIMKEVLTLLAPTARVPEDAGMLSATYRKVLSGKRMLLVFDDVRDAAQVDRLAPPEPVAVLITSRSPIALKSAERWQLDTLTAEEAVALLREILGGRPNVGEDELRALAERCGYLPLALRIAAGFLASRPSWSVEDYLQALKDPLENIRPRNIRDVLALQLDQLLQDDIELSSSYRLLAVFPVGFLPNAAASVWQIPETKARETLEALVTRSLVYWDHSTNRFYLHDVLRELAGEGLDPQERERAAARHAEHYVEVLRKIDDLYRDGESLQQALALFDAERANIETGQAWAAANVALSPRAADLAFQYTDVGAYVLNLRLSRPEWVGWLETAVKACRKLGNRQGEASALGNLGLAWESLGDIRKAIGLYEQHLTVARELGDRRGEGGALGNLGLALASLGDIHKAITLHEQHLAIARELGDRRSEGNALGNLGLACASLGEIRKAAELYQQHLLIARELGDRRSEGNALGNLGLAYASWGDIRKATEFYEQHLAIARELGDRRGEASALSNLGNAAFSQGDLSLAAKAYEEAIAIARQIGDRLREERNLGNLGNVYWAAGEINSAVYSYGQQLELSRMIGDRRGEGNALWNSALALEELGEPEKAIANAKAALAIRHQLDDPNAAKVAEWLRERETTRK